MLASRLDLRNPSDETSDDALKVFPTRRPSCRHSAPRRPVAIGVMVSRGGHGRGGRSIRPSRAHLPRTTGPVARTIPKLQIGCLATGRFRAAAQALYPAQPMLSL